MPGIVGLITRRPKPWAEAQLSRMLESQRHETFYTSGTWADESAGTYVGWTALPGSFADSMPLTNERGDLSLIFSGEEFPEPGCRDRLRQMGHAVNGNGPSHLIHWCEQDPEFLNGLNGVFHGVVVDHTRGTTLLFNDRMGMHRLHYYEAGDTWYFAAEAKSILVARPDLRVADVKSLGEFIACNCVLENRTIFKDIHVMPAASAWTFRNGALASKRTYFLPADWENQTPLESESFYQALKEVWSRNLPRYFAGTQKKGIALTGGFDTRLIMAWGKPDPNTLQSYTFAGMIRDSRDVKIAARVARHCQQPYEVIRAGDEFLSAFPAYAERTMFLSEGGTDVYHASDLFVSAKARQLAPVKIVGTYGSEILRRVVMFKPTSTFSVLFEPEFAGHIADAGATYDQFAREHPLTFAAFRQFPWYHHGILGLEQTQLTVRSPFLDQDFLRTAYRAPRSTAADFDVRPRLVADADPRLAEIPSDRGASSQRDLLARLRRLLHEFSFKAEYAYDYGMPPWAAPIDHALSWLHLERLFLGHHKFLHFRIWYRDRLAEYVRQMLLDSRTLARPFLNRKMVENVVTSHLKGTRNFTSEIHKLLSLELLHRLFFDSQSS